MLKKYCDKCGCQVKYTTMDSVGGTIILSGKECPDSFPIIVSVAGTSIRREYCRNCTLEILPGVVADVEEKKPMDNEKTKGQKLLERFEDIIRDVVQDELDERGIC